MRHYEAHLPGDSSWENFISEEISIQPIQLLPSQGSKQMLRTRREPVSVWPLLVDTPNWNGKAWANQHAARFSSWDKRKQSADNDIYIYMNMCICIHNIDACAATRWKDIACANLESLLRLLSSLPPGPHPGYFYQDTAFKSLKWSN